MAQETGEDQEHAAGVEHEEDEGDAGDMEHTDEAEEGLDAELVR